MISLVRPNGHAVVVNADLIEIVERDDDGTTIVTLTSGNVLVVHESPSDVAEAAIAYRRRIGGIL